jgi:serpin B
VVRDSFSLPIPTVFWADHPFVFLILDDESGNILFMGRMAAPS